MIKINLLTEKKQVKTKAPAAIKVEGAGGGRNLLLVAILVVGAVIAGGWWFTLSNEHADWVQKHTEADRELERLAEIRKKGEEYKKRKELLQRKIDLITELKKQQAVPVHILDEISKNLPDFLWLESMSSGKNSIDIKGKATTYNAVSNFYSNLTGSGHFQDVSLGRTFEVPEGVSFSLTARYTGPGEAAAKNEQPQG
jgi:Tfp pilus assembly protein PilN